MRRTLAFLGGALLLVVFGVVARAPAANAITVTTCPSTGTYHVYGNQWASGQYYGQYGWLKTYEPSVPDYTTAFSLSHLYSFYGDASPFNSSTWNEVGWYRGEGNQNYTISHYYYAWGDHGAYHEVDTTSAPTEAVTYLYQVLFEGHNYTLGTDDWNVYFNGTATVRGTIHQSSQPYSHAMAGGEVQGDSTSYTAMLTRGSPNQQIISEDYTWYNWTTLFGSTAACQSSGITYTILSDFMSYTATGQA